MDGERESILERIHTCGRGTLGLGGGCHSECADDGRMDGEERKEYVQQGGRSSPTKIG